MRDGNGEIYVMNRDGTDQTRLTNAPSLEQSPDWQPLPQSTSAGKPGFPVPQTMPDKRAPRLTLRLRRRQRALRRGAVIVSAKCDEACTVAGSGKVTGPEGRKWLKLKRASRTLAAGVRARLRLRVSKRVTRILRGALSRHRMVMARITITARDHAGNARSITRKVKITP